MRPPTRKVLSPSAGFSLVELTVTLAIMAIVVTLTVGLIVGLQKEQVNVNSTITGARQSQLASSEVVQYLRAAATPISASVSPPSPAYPSWFSGSYSETDTSLELPVWIGVQTAPSTPNVDILQLTYQSSCTPACPAGAGELKVTIIGDTGKSRTLATYAVVAPSTPIFTYYSYAPNTGDTQPMAVPAGGITANCALVQIVAVSINLSMFASGSHADTSPFAADLATTLQTTVYLRNADATFGSTTTSTTIPPGGCVT